MATILVIDDEKSILENIKFVLELENYEVITTDSSETGISIFQEKSDQIDTVITDMRMPHYTGMDVLREVRRLVPEMSVIVLTGHGDLENAILTMKEGAFEYLRKPVNADKLTIAVNNAVIRKSILIENFKMHTEILEHRNYLQGLNDSAHKILLNMLPKKFPALDDFNFSVKYKSSDDVGGDMYDICDIGDYLCFYLFDVSSHGILAAVVSVILNSFLQNIEYNYRQGINTRRFPEIVEDLNMEMNSNTAQNVFATLFLAFIDKKTKQMYYISAGHITQCKVSNDKITPLHSTGTILGVFEDAKYSCNIVNLEKGDKIVLFTDGIVEAPSDDGLFGYDSVEWTLSQNSTLPIEDVVQTLYNTAHDYVKGNFDDDVTVVGIEII